MAKLVKDYLEHKIVFYWQSEGSKRASPTFPSLIHAKEWLINQYFDSYKGPERRKHKVDRRSLQKGDFSSKRDPYTHGRRITDRPIKVDINLADQKIADLVQYN
ncbi:hypothetical protein ACMXYR_05660 [Neptuniibacter sp. QD29_5]|uniref:hypothetical protein n=1 Tax=Neptuniibacter sp. QD29_5 TaxID=3398207 RepID=UPI0039F49DDD